MELIKRNFSFPLINQVSLKSPEVQLTLPIHMGNVSIDKKLRPSKRAASAPSAAAEDTPASTSTPDASTSATTPTLPPRSAPKPAPRPVPRSRMSSHNSPSAPPAECHLGAEGGTPSNDGFPNKRQSQLVSPNAFSYAPGLFFSQGQQHNGPGTAPNEPMASGSTGATAPYPPGVATSMSSLLILPPDYGNSAYPQGQLAQAHFILALSMNVKQNVEKNNLGLIATPNHHQFRCSNQNAYKHLKTN